MRVLFTVSGGGWSGPLRPLHHIAVDEDYSDGYTVFTLFPEHPVPAFRRTMYNLVRLPTAMAACEELVSRQASRHSFPDNHERKVS